MFKVFHCFVAVVVIALFLGCGGNGSSSTGSSGTARDGRIEVHNNVASDPGSRQVPMYVYY